MESQEAAIRGWPSSSSTGRRPNESASHPPPMEAAVPVARNMAAERFFLLMHRFFPFNF